PRISQFAGVPPGWTWPASAADSHSSASTASLSAGKFRSDQSVRLHPCEFDDPVFHASKQFRDVGIRLFLILLPFHSRLPDLARLLKRPRQRRHRLDAGLVVTAGGGVALDRFHLAHKLFRQRADAAR